MATTTFTRDCISLATSKLDGNGWFFFLSDAGQTEASGYCDASLYLTLCHADDDPTAEKVSKALASLRGKDIAPGRIYTA